MTKTVYWYKVIYMYYFGSSFIKIKLCFDSLFCILVLLPWRLQLPCPLPNVPIENIWAIKIHQAEVGREGDHKPQLPEA